MGVLCTVPVSTVWSSRLGKFGGSNLRRTVVKQIWKILQASLRSIGRMESGTFCMVPGCSGGRCFSDWSISFNSCNCLKRWSGCSAQPILTRMSSKCLPGDLRAGEFKEEAA